jgi:ubiquinone/menaquinone biosynthesis C-methylase UbiE/uncharacterized protein YbaR (Trm112 family)
LEPQEDYTIFYCPITKEDLYLAGTELLDEINKKTKTGKALFEKGLVNSSATYFYPVVQNILHLLPSQAVPLKETSSAPGKMEFDRERVFNYYNNINYYDAGGQQVYADAGKFVDFRSFLLPYTQHGFANAGRYLLTTGKYFIDVASGPVAFKEYVELANGFETRICVDSSASALMQAQKNLALHDQKGIFVCGDMAQLPVKDNVADAVICQHALFHVQKNLQQKALSELIRIAKPGCRTAIVYDWFYHSWFMNMALGPVQLYRIARHFAGKLYARWFKKNTLYFFSHSPRWFYRNNPGKKMNIYVWRSINIYFSRLYLHEKFFGKKLIRYIWKLEEKYPEKMGLLGEYAVIVIEK